MSAANHSPTCWIIAGPNGAGKTTFALEYLPNTVGCRQFVNADLIAAGMAPLAPETERVAAGRIFLKEIERHVSACRNFGFETTLAGRGYIRQIHRLRKAGWRVELIYLALPDPEAARQRVAERVAHGGHDIPEADIQRRFYRGLRNLFDAYIGETDRTRCFSNDGELPELVFVQEEGRRDIYRQDVLSGLLGMVRK